MDNTEVTETAPVNNEEVDTEMDFSISLEPEDDAGDITPDADAGDKGTEESEQEPTETDEDQGEYKLDLSELDNDDMPYADILTAQAKAAGLKAAEASKFIVGFTKELHSYHAKLEEAEGQALKKEWGKEFKAKRDQTAAFMGKLFAKAEVTEEERAMFANPRMFRVMRKLMGCMGEQKSAPVKAAPVKVLTRQEQINERVTRLVSLQEDPNANRDAISKLKTEINNIARIKLY